MRQPAIDVYILHESHFSSILYDVEYSFACFLGVTNDVLYSFDLIKSPARFTLPLCLANMRQKPKEISQTVSMMSKVFLEKGLGCYLQFVLPQSE